MHRPLRIALPLALGWVLLTAPPSSGQTPAGAGAPEEQSVFGETIDVRVVNLEVVVVDGEGRRVTGLKPSELRLLVDGQPVAIDYFTEVVEGRAAAEGSGAAGAPHAVEGVEPGGAVGTSYLVFVDDSLTGVTRDRNIVLKGLADELSRLRQEDRMAVVRYAGTRPELVAGWSRPAEVRAALERAMAQPVRSHAAQAELGHLDAVEAVGEEPAPMPGVSGSSFPRPIDGIEGPDSGCDVVHNFERRLQKVASAFTATLRSLSGVPGRKVALVVSGGWPPSAMEYVLGTGIRRPAGCKVVGPALWDPVHQTANQLGFTLYPVLAPDLGQAVAAELDDYGVPLTPQAIDSQFRETLDRMARETGGEAYAGGARRDLLARVAADTASFYWLGFTPTWKGDDRGHQVTVEVLRPGLTVRTRRGFQDLSRQSEVTHMVESALLFGHPPGVLPLKVGLAPKGRPRKDTARVTLRVQIPMDQITMVQRGRQYVAELELRVAFLDEQGNRNDIPVIPVKLSGPRPQPGQYAVYETELDLRRQKQDMVVALFDPPSGRLLETRAQVQP